MPAGTIRSALRGILFAVLVFAPVATAAQAGTPADPNLTQRAQGEAPIALPSLAPLVRHVLPAVVNVSVVMNEGTSFEGQGSGDEAGNSPFGPGSTPFDQFLRHFFEGVPHPPGEKIMALGSGFIIDPQGYIVTNNHVVAHAEKVTVIFQDGSRHPAKVIGRDKKTDLALLKIHDGDHLPYVSWGNSKGVEVGDWVVAVGNPFGLGGTVTAGIVSALNRNIGDGPYDNFLQIDAPINRGNSGGPTFNLKGQVIGINTAIYSPSGGSVGIGFAIPSNVAKYVITQLKEHGRVTWGWLGVEIQSVTPSIAKSLGLNPNHPEGALVAEVLPNTPAAKAGLESGDVITEANGIKINTVHDLPRVVAESPIGSRLNLKIIRSGKEETIAATVGKAPKNEEAELRQGPGAGPASALGIELAPLTHRLRSELGIPKDVRGVVVAKIAANSPALALGLRPGDVIMSVNRRSVRAPHEAAQALRKAAAHGNILLLINRHGTSEFVALSIRGGRGSGG